MPAIQTRARQFKTGAEVLANYREVRDKLRALPSPRREAPECAPAKAHEVHEPLVDRQMEAVAPSLVLTILYAACAEAKCSRLTLFSDLGSEEILAARRAALGLAALRLDESPEVVAAYFGVLAEAVVAATERVRSILVAFAIPLSAPPSAIIRAVISGARPAPDRPTINAIKRAVCAEFGISEVEIESDRRTRGVCIPRMVAMALARRLTIHSLPVIGHHLGDRDHTTVMHAVRRAQPLIDAIAKTLPPDATLDQWVSALRVAWDERERAK